MQSNFLGMLSTNFATICIRLMVKIRSTICPEKNVLKEKLWHTHINKQIDMPSMYKTPVECTGRRKGEKFMADKIFENNQVSIVGTIVSDFHYSHEVYGEGFYMVDVSVNRLSNFVDIIPVMVSERIVDVTKNYEGSLIYVQGQFRSYNRHEEKKNRLVLSVFARELEFIEEESEELKSNQIYLDGYICKEPIYRKTPLGREIADLLIAVNRSYGKSDYIPCICWGRNARFASSFEVGSHVEIWGRIQSREYVKKINENETEKRIAYEVSVSKIERFE